MISFVIPTYNRASRVVRAIESVRSQAGDAQVEIVVVDDGSSDDTPQALAALAPDERVRVVRLERNRGVNAAKNRGAQEARGTWLVFLDSDNELLPGGLAALRRFIDDNASCGLIWVGCSDHNGNLLSEGMTDSSEASYEGLLSGKISGEFMPVAKRDDYLGATLYEDLTGFEHLTWVKIARRSGFQILREPVCRYDDEGEDRLSHPSNIITNSARMVRGFRRCIEDLGPELKRAYPSRLDWLALRLVFYCALAEGRAAAVKEADALRRRGLVSVGAYLRALIIAACGPRLLSRYPSISLSVRRLIKRD